MARWALAALLFITTTNAYADDVRADAFLVDVLLARPVGLAATICSSALFVAISPLTAFAMIPPPHDAFDIATDKLILTPFNFTFSRPVGVFYPDMQSRHQRYE
ncbi:hypothetical protein [Methylomonas sp. MgM2]